MRAFAIILLCASASFAKSECAVIERLAEAAWLPQQVQAEWQTAGKLPETLAQHDDWQLVEPRPVRLAGSVVLTLERNTEIGKIERVSLSGTLRISGPSLATKRMLNKGDKITSADVEPVQTDWTYLAGDVLRASDLNAESVAAHNLLPRRVLTKRDVTAEPRIHRGQTVDVVYEEGNVRVRLAGRALKDGAIGEHVQVAVELKTSRKFEGLVAADGTVQLIR